MTATGGQGAFWDSHVLLVNHDDSHRRANVMAWVQRGLDRRDKILYSTVEGDPVLVPELRQVDSEVAKAVREGQFAFLPLEDFFPGARQADLVRRALDEGYPGVRLSAQSDAAVRGVGADDYRAIDHRMDELCASLPVSALCQYDAGGVNGAILTTVIDSHPDAVQDARMRLCRRADGTVVAGEVDVASAAVLERVLRRICREGSSELVLDVSGLTFVDVVGCRAMTVGTEAFRRHGGTVFCRGLNGHIRRVMCLLGMDRLPGVALV